MRVTALTCRCPRRLAEELGAELITLGAGGVEERRVPGGVEVVTWIEERAEAERLAAALGARLGELGEHDAAWRKVVFGLRDHEQPDWHRAWLEALEPVQLTARVRWSPAQASDGERDGPERPAHAVPGAGNPGDATAGAPASLVSAAHVELVYRPAVVFGDGSHVTTRLAAAAVEAWCQAHPGGRVLDVGTGNGVLALVAVVSGAASALGIDVDRTAIETARATAALNALSDRCTFEERPLGEVTGTFGLVVANVAAPFLVEAAPALAARVAPGGRLVVTGLLDDRAAEVGAALEAAGLTRGATHSAEGWALLEADRGGAVGA